MDASADTIRGITFQPDIYGKVMTLLPEDKHARILDVGAGQGYFCRQMRAGGHTAVDACDFNEENFQCPEAAFFAANLNESIPAGDETYDCVVSIEVIEHLENHFRFMEELVRVTKKGGTIIVTTPNVLNISGRLHTLFCGFNDCAPYPLDPDQPDYYNQHINPVSLPELLYHFERFGCELVGLTTNRIRKGAWIPMLLLYPLMSVLLRWNLYRASRRLQRRNLPSRDALFKRHRRWMLSPANLMGRITIAVASRKVRPGFRG